MLKSCLTSVQSDYRALLDVPGLYKLVGNESEKYPHKEGKYRLALSKKPPRRILCEALLDLANGYTTLNPVPDASKVASARPSKVSKTRASHPSTQQKATLTQQAIEDGSIKTTALSRQLRGQNVQRAIPVQVSRLHTMLLSPMFINIASGIRRVQNRCFDYTRHVCDRRQDWRQDRRQDRRVGNLSMSPLMVLCPSDSSGFRRASTLVLRWIV